MDNKPTPMFSGMIKKTVAKAYDLPEDLLDLLMYGESFSDIDGNRIPPEKIIITKEPTSSQRPCRR